jgi:hypothetical protein
MKGDPMRSWLSGFVLLSVAPISLGSFTSCYAGALPEEPETLSWQRMLESKEMVTRYLIRVARELTDRAASEFSTRAAWEKVKEQRRLELLDMLGLNPLPARTPLNLRVTGVIEKGEYTIEKLAFESLPRIFATANLYLPRSRNQRVPAVIYGLRPLGLAAWQQGAVPASRHHLRQAWIRLSDH